MTDSAEDDALLAGFGSGNAVKVPAATLLFWIIKILSTGLGETSSDYLVGAFNPKIAVVFGATLIALSLAVQWLWPRFNTWVYWLAVLMVSIFGTMAADVVHRVLGVPYAISSLAFAFALALTFWLWSRVEGTLSIHSIQTRRREGFYWAVVLLTFALGTALGDMSAHTLNLGYLPSAFIYLALILLPPLAWRRALFGPVAAFWSSYVLTRPLGASFADWFGAPVPRGGLGLGFGPVSAALMLVFLALVAYAAQSHDGTEPA